MPRFQPTVIFFVRSKAESFVSKPLVAVAVIFFFVVVVVVVAVVF